MGQGNQRNAPCWCGSGKKTKQCHLRRAETPRKGWPQAIAEVMKPFQSKRCMHPEAKTACQGKIVQAHTIPHSRLKMIARDGHVYTYRPIRDESARHRGLIAVDLVGVRKTSTFWGFCKKHDRELFLPIENGNPLLPMNIEQVFLLGYRALAAELYKKQAALEGLKQTRTMDAGMPFPMQARMQSFLDSQQAGLTEGLQDLEAIKKTADSALTERDWSEVRGYVIVTDKCPPVLCSAGKLFEFDFQENRLGAAPLKRESRSALKMAA